MGQFENLKENSQDFSRELGGKDLGAKELGARELGEWALGAARFFQSEQTGYLHLYAGDSHQRAQTIPLFENFLFVLALFRSRLVEQVQEGKGLLRQLLVFQNLNQGDDYGNFPVYLHQYPHCQDPALSTLLLSPFFWIWKQFAHILGADLKTHFEKAIHFALEHAIRSHENKPFPYFLSVRLAASQYAFGLCWNKSEWIEKGRVQLEQLAQKQLEGWQTTRQLAEVLVGLQMVYPSLSQSPWGSLWRRMEQTWHPHLACYIGPCVREWQEKEEPQVNLYDLFCGCFSGQFSRRATHLGPHHLQGVLIQPSLDKFNFELGMKEEVNGENSNSPSLVVQGELKNQIWRTIYHREWAYHLLEKNGVSQPSVDKTYTLYRFVWGDLHRLHSLVCQGGNIEKVKVEEEGNSVVMLFDLRDSLMGEEENAPKQEIEFFVDLHPDIQFHVEGLSSTTFKLGEAFQVSFKGYCLSMIFELVQGQGDFLGHLMRSNRPSQIDNKGEKRFQAYDWTFFLRTIRRQSHCRIRATLTFCEFKDALS